MFLSVRRNSRKPSFQPHLLNKDQLSMLTLPDVLLEDLDAKLAELSASSQIEIKALSTSILQESGMARRSKATDTFTLRTIVYGIKNGQPVTTEQLSE